MTHWISDRTPLVFLALCIVLCSCRRPVTKENDAGLAANPMPASPPPEIAPPMPDTVAPEPATPLPALKPKAQPEGTRIAYNGLETFMRGTIAAGERKGFLLRVRKDQQVRISLDPPDAGISLAVLDEQGAGIGTPGTAWQWTTTYAGDLRVVVFSGTDKAKSGQKAAFTLRVAPY